MEFEFQVKLINYRSLQKFLTKLYSTELAAMQEADKIMSENNITFGEKILYKNGKIDYVIHIPMNKNNK